MSRNRRIAVVAALVLALIIAGYAYLSRNNRDGQLVLFGNVDIREVDLAFRQPGRLATVAFDEGSTVKAGQIMAELDAQPYRDALAGAEAEVLRAGVELEKLNRGNRPQEIAQAQEAVRQADAAFRNAEADYRRQSALVESGSVSQKTSDTAKMVRDQAEAGLEAAKKALELKKEGWRREDIAESAARLKVAESALAQAKTALEDTRLIAPADGVVLTRQREPGSMVTSRDGVFTLSLGNPVYVRAYVGESDLGTVVPGTPVTVHSDSSKKNYSGLIGFVSPRAEFTPKSVETADLRTDLVYRLRIVVRDADESLRQGMPVTVRIQSTTSGG